MPDAKAQAQGSGLRAQGSESILRVLARRPRLPAQDSVEHSEMPRAVHVVSMLSKP